MSTLLEYIAEYGDRSFTELPFNEVDNLLLCKLSYLPFEEVIGAGHTAPPVPFPEAANLLFRHQDKKFRPLGLMIDETVSVYSMTLAHTKRFGEIKIAACTGRDENHPAVQFGAQTYLLPDGNFVVPFRGTNDSVFGWKEDLDILAKGYIPSYGLALDYFRSALKAHGGGAILCGHSKGGHLALYTALHVSDQERGRLIAVYNNDGPGFPDYSPYRTEAYRAIRPIYHHFLPDSSMVGLMLAHDMDYEVVVSSQILGAKQHDVTTWQADGVRIERAAEGLTEMGRITDHVMRRMVSGATDRKLEAIEHVADSLIDAAGQATLTGLAQNVSGAVQGAAREWVKLPRRDRRIFVGFFAETGRNAMEAFRSVKRPHADPRGRIRRLFIPKET